MGLKGNYRNKVENTKDYMGDERAMFRNLPDIINRPEGAEIQTHLRMMYGHMDWDGMVVELTPDIIRQLRKNEDSIGDGWNALRRIKEGDHVVLLNSYSMEPVTYIEMMTDSSEIDLLDLDEAIERAVYWFVEDLFDSELGFTMFSKYFLVVFRLALMEDNMDDKRY